MQESGHFSTKNIFLDRVHHGQSLSTMSFFKVFFENDTFKSVKIDRLIMIADDQAPVTAQFFKTLGM